MDDLAVDERRQAAEPASRAPPRRTGSSRTAAGTTSRSARAPTPRWPSSVTPSDRAGSRQAARMARHRLMPCSGTNGRVVGHPGAAVARDRRGDARPRTRRLDRRVGAERQQRAGGVERTQRERVADPAAPCGTCRDGVVDEVARLHRRRHAGRREPGHVRRRHQLCVLDPMVRRRPPAAARPPARRAPGARRRRRWRGSAPRCPPGGRRRPAP